MKGSRALQEEGRAVVVPDSRRVGRRPGGAGGAERAQHETGKTQSIC